MINININIIPLFILIAVVVSLFLFWKRAVAEGFSESKAWDFSLGTLFFGLIFGRIYKLIWNFQLLEGNYLNFFKLWSGDLAYAGALAGAGVFSLYLVIRNKWSIYKILDILVIPLAIGRTIIALGYFVGGYNKPLALYELLASVSVLLILVILSSLKVFIGFWGVFGFSLIFIQDFVFSLIRSEKHLVFGVNVDALITLAFLVLTLVGLLKRFKKLGFANIFNLFKNMKVTFKNIKNPLKKKAKLSDSFVSNAHEKLEKEDKSLEHQEQEVKKSDPFLNKERLSSNEYLDDAQEDIGKASVDRSSYSLAKMQIQVRRALAKIHLGTYGICEKCGKEIQMARLQAFPATTLCKDCAEKEEKKSPKN